MTVTAAYYKSLIGILKLLAVIFVAIVVGLSCYAHFNSHWSYHGRQVDKAERKKTFINSENDYEDCTQNNQIYPNIMVTSQTEEDSRIQSGLFDPERHSRDGSDTGDKSMTKSRNVDIAICPKPVLELLLVSISISLLILSFLALMFVKIIIALRFHDLIFNVLAALFLLIGSILFFYSVYHISEWCAIKARLASSGYFLHNMVLVGPPDDSTSTSVTSETPSAHDVLAMQKLTGEDHAKDIATMPHTIDEHVAYLHRSHADYELACLLTHLTDEKYAAAGMALVAAVLYAIIAILLLLSFRRNRITKIDAETQGEDDWEEVPAKRFRKSQKGKHNRKEAMTADYAGDDEDMFDDLFIEGGLCKPRKSKKGKEKRDKDKPIEI